MNVAAERYPPRVLKQPAGLKKIEICSRSGLLATDKCYDAVKGEMGGTVQRRTTYEEIATATQAPTESCNIHGEPSARLARALPAAEFPRASLAVDLNDVMPVIVKAPALLADKDPYNSARPVMKPVAEPDKSNADPTAENKIDTGTTGNRATTQVPEQTVIPKAIPKAIPVTPEEKASEEPIEIRKAVPVGPLDEIKDETLLQQSATPPPGDSDQQ
jgi:hypothetical protein